MGCRRLGIHRAGDRALHQEGRCAADGGQGVVDGDALHREDAGGHGRVGDVGLNRLERGVDPIEHGVALRDRDAAQSARDDLAVAGGVAHTQADAVVAQGEGDAGQAEAARRAGIGAQALREQADGAPRFGGAAQGDDGCTRLSVIAVQGIGPGDAEARADRCRGVEPEGEIEWRAGIAGRVLGDDAHGVGAISQQPARQAVEQGAAEREAAVGLQLGAGIGQGRRGADGVEGNPELGHADVVAGLAGEGRVVRDGIAGRAAGVVLQFGGDGGWRGVGRDDGFAHDGQGGRAGVASGVRPAQVEVVAAQGQGDADQAEAAIRCSHGAAEHGARALGAQGECSAGLGLADQGHDRRAGSVVAERAGVAGGGQAEAGERGRLAVEREGEVERGGIAGRVLGHQAQAVRALGERATGEAVELAAAERKCTAGLEECGEIGQRGRRVRVQRGQELGDGEVVAGGAGDAWVARQAVAGVGAGVVHQRGAERGRGGVGDGVSRHGQADLRAVARGIGGVEREGVVAQIEGDASEAEAAVGGGHGGSEDGGTAGAAQAQACAGLGRADQADRRGRGVVVTGHAGVARRCQREAGDDRGDPVGRRGGECRERGWIESLAAHPHAGREQRRDDVGAAQQLAADHQLLQALHGRAELHIVAVAVDAIDRVNTDVDLAVDHIPRHPHPGQGARLEAVGIGGATAERRVIAQIGADQQAHAAHGAAHLQQLQGAHG